MTLPRLIDANANRAREGLRLLEDCARFLLSDAALTSACKDARHAVTDAVAQLADAHTLLLSRDTPGDVGTSVSNPSELSRPTVATVVAAAAGRVTEAIRALEEAAKLLDRPSAARTLEATRYRVYDIHKRLALLLGPAHRRQPRLCVLLTTSLCTHHPLLEVARASLQAGADCLQLREKSLTDRELLPLARSLVALAREHQAAVFVNDRTDIALAAGAHGVHLGQTDLPAGQARRLCGTRLLIGVSTSRIEEAHAAARDGADLCGVGPMFPTTTKHKPRLAGPAYLRQYLSDETTRALPHLAIGGITPANADELAEAGCQGFAVSSVVCGATDPGAVCRALLERLTPRSRQGPSSAPGSAA
ncbi:MAG: thiamine phosphate synthase [Phycisphaerales bacterium]